MQNKKPNLLVFVKKVDAEDNIIYTVDNQMETWVDGENYVHALVHDPKKVTKLKINVTKKDENKSGHVLIEKVMLNGEDITHQVSNMYTYISDTPDGKVNNNTYLWLGITGVFTMFIRYTPKIHGVVYLFLNAVK
jgi:hypothetical protein